MKTVQHLNETYLEQCRQMKPIQILEFLDNFRQLHHQQLAKSKLISLKVPESLLTTFRQQCEMEGIAYQTKIKQLMQEYLKN
jgi:predicted DNA binding CopG/RHH family protein